MGTRADFYVGCGENAKWLGSISCDGYPDGIDDGIFQAMTEEDFEAAVTRFFEGRDDVSGPDHGWPWPWLTSGLTDCTYAFDDGRVYMVWYGYKPWKAIADLHPEDCECDECEFSCDCGSGEVSPRMWQCEHKVVFPDMTRFKNNPPIGSLRSGVMLFTSEGLADG